MFSSWKAALGAAALLCGSHAAAGSHYNFAFTTLGAGQTISGYNTAQPLTSTFLNNVTINYSISTAIPFFEGAPNNFVRFIGAGYVYYSSTEFGFGDPSTIGRYAPDIISARACVDNGSVGPVPTLGTFAADPACGGARISFNDDIFSTTEYTGRVTSVTISLAEAGALPARVVNGVPEPTTWALILTGFGIVGVAMRGRRPRHHTVPSAA